MILIIAMPFLANAENITIRWAQKTDLAAICAFDRAVTYEYFKPLYQQHYAHFELGKNPDPFLEKELAADEHDFKQFLEADNDRLFIAVDNDHIVGLLVCHSEGKVLELDLLLIAQDSRKKGIGKKLIQAMLAANLDATQCIVYPIRGNQDAIIFYEKLGFVNQGIPAIDKKNIYGIAYADMYWQYELGLKKPESRASS